MSANAARGRSERTQRRQATQKEQMLEAAQQQLIIAKGKIEITAEIKIALPKTHVPQGKIVLTIEDLTFSHNSKSLIQNFNLTVQGPEKIAIVGDNGSGKTTLIQLILGKLKPQKGKMYHGVQSINYLDQQTMLLNPQLTLLENFLQLNPTMKPQEAHYCLAQFLFKNVEALKKVNVLSGGEKLRAALACLLLSKQPPQLLILDEPTNHLDLTSITSLESALNCYQGALIVISHDQTFLEKIGVHKTVNICNSP